MALSLEDGHLLPGEGWADQTSNKSSNEINEGTAALKGIKSERKLQRMPHLDSLHGPVSLLWPLL